ncbi:hypothetical protein LZ005_07330 [Massilia sp. TS11]|nr:hypothetical protein [Massilia sp. TS11]
MSVIGRTVFELDTPNVLLARAAQEAVSRFARAALAESLDAAVAAQPVTETAQRYSSIVLDLGQVCLDRMEHELGPRIEAAMRSFLLGQRGLQREAAQLVAAEPEPLTRFAAWLHGAPVQELAALLRAALALPDAAALLRRHGRQFAVRRRLAMLAPALLAGVLDCLEPEQAATVLAVVTEVVAAHRQRPLVAAGRAEFALAVWEFVFSYLLLERGSYFNTRALAAHVLAGIASRYRISYRDLLGALVAVAARPGLPQARGLSLPVLLQDLYGALVPEAELTAAPPSTPLAALSHVLWHGVLAPAEAGVSLLGLGDLLERAIAEQPDALRELLRSLGQHESVRTRLAMQAGAQRLRAVVRVLEPEQDEWVLGTVDAVQAAQDRQRLAQEDGRRFGLRLWGLVLQILLVERGSHFNTRAFVRRLIESTAAATGRRYRDWLDALCTAPQWQHAAGRRPRLARVLEELQREQPADGREETAQRQMARGLLARVAPGRLPTRAALRELVRRLARRQGLDVHRVLAELAREGGSLAQAALAEQALAALLLSLHAQWLGSSRSEAAAPAPVGGAVAGTPTAGMARAVREFAVRSLVLERGSWFNDRSYVDHLVRQLARRHGLAYADLLGTLAAAASGRILAAQDRQLPAVLRSLQEAQVQAVPGWDFLASGNPGGAQWRQVLADGPRLAPPAAVLAALRADADGQLAQRLADYLPLTSLRTLLAQLAPDWAGALATLLEAGGDGAADWGAMLAVLAQRTPAPALHDVLTAFGARRAGAASAYWRRLWRVAAARCTDPRFAALADLCETQLRRAGLALPPPPSAPAQERRWPDQAPARVLAEALERLLRLGPSAWRARWREAPETGTLLARVAAALADHPAVFLAVLRAALARPLERERLAHLLPPALRAQILRSLLGQRAGPLLWWRAAMASSLAALAPRVAADFWLQLLDVELLRQLGPGRRRPELAAWLQAVGRRAWQEALLDWPRLLADWRRRAGQLAAAEGRAAQRLLAHLEQRPPPAAPRLPPAPLAEEVPIQLANAGMVLLWPFFGHLFARLGLTAGAAFRDEAAQMRAVHLLDYLVWGRWSSCEEELALPKLLCGLALETALLPCDGPSEDERRLCEEMLAAVIAHWGRLGNTSPEGLQQTFLQRAGELRRKDGNWHVRVPERPFDVLLTTLPWALGTVRLSWMKDIVWVSWK